MTTAPFQYPVLYIGRWTAPDADPGQEVVDYFVDDDAITHCTLSDIKRGEREGMLLFDSAGRCCRIESVQDLGRDATFWDWVWRFLGSDSLHHRIACELTELDPWPIEALRERVCAAIAGNPDCWRDDEAIAGEDGPPQDEQELLAALQEKVRQAQSVPQIVEALYPDD